jgi:hypothetical protein
VATSASIAGPSGSPSVKLEVPKPQKKRIIPGGTLYRGREGMWSWVLHRITGVAIYFFLLVHILDTALVRVSPEAYNIVIGSYSGSRHRLSRAERDPHHLGGLLEHRNPTSRGVVLCGPWVMAGHHDCFHSPSSHERFWVVMP